MKLRGAIPIDFIIAYCPTPFEVDFEPGIWLTAFKFALWVVLEPIDAEVAWLFVKLWLNSLCDFKTL